LTTRTPFLNGGGLDRAIARVSPGWAARRCAARLRAELDRQRLAYLSTYEAAEKSRHTADWSAKNKSADQIITADYWTILARARAAARDDWSAASIADGYVRHVVGTGITAQANARDPVSGQAWEDFNTAIDLLWKLWSERPIYCDLEHNKCLEDIQALMEREVINAGQAFAIMDYVPRPGMVGLTLQLFEPEQLDRSRTTWRDPVTGEDHDIANGIELDDHGAAVAYHVYTGKHPYTSYGGDSTRVPAHRVLHLMRQDRVRQSQGVTRYAPVLREMWHGKMYAEYTLLRARFEACGGVSVKRELEGSPANFLGLRTDSAADELDANDNLQLNFEPNMVLDPGPGVALEFHDPKVPGGQYEPFTKQGTKKTAAGAGLDYPTVSRDFSGNTFSGQRQGMIENWMETDPEQRRMISGFLRPVRETFIDLAIMEARVAAPLYHLGLAYRTAYMETTYQPQPRQWIDPANQAAAAKIALETDLDSYERLLAERGYNWRKHFRQRADETQLRSDLGLGAGDAPKPSAHEPRPEADHATPPEAGGGLAAMGIVRGLGGRNGGTRP